MAVWRPKKYQVVEDKTAAFFPWNLRTRKEDSCWKKPINYCEPLIIYTPLFLGQRHKHFNYPPWPLFFSKIFRQKERQSDRTLKFIRCKKAQKSKIKAVQDLIATSTMLLDLTWFGNVLYCKDVSDLSILGLVVCQSWAGVVGWCKSCKDFPSLGVECPFWGFPKMVGFPNNPMGFPTKNDQHLGCEMGVLYH